jgi:hypothetical protein
VTILQEKKGDSTGDARAYTSLSRRKLETTTTGITCQGNVWASKGICDGGGVHGQGMEMGNSEGSVRMDFRARKGCKKIVRSPRASKRAKSEDSCSEPKAATFPFSYGVNKDSTWGPSKPVNDCCLRLLKRKRVEIPIRLVESGPSVCLHLHKRVGPFTLLHSCSSSTSSPPPCWRHRGAERMKPWGPQESRKSMGIFAIAQL